MLSFPESHVRKLIIYAFYRVYIFNFASMILVLAYINGDVYN